MVSNKTGKTAEGVSRQRSLRFAFLQEPETASLKLAEREGFEPSVPCGTHDFQSCTFGLSVTSPQVGQNTTKV
jgi:hypothetical protein